MLIQKIVLNSIYNIRKNDFFFIYNYPIVVLSLIVDLILVDSGVSLRPQDRGPAAKKASRRREPRRHTVSNGIDYNMVIMCYY